MIIPPQKVEKERRTVMIRPIGLFFLLLFYLLRPVLLQGQTASVPSYISSQSDYQVRALTGSYAPTNGKETLDSVTPTEWLTAENHANIIAPWSGGPYAISGTKLFVHGGGHSDSANNGMYVFDFSGTTAPTGWTLPAISAVANVVPNTNYADGKPMSVHTYNGQVYATHNNTVYRLGGSMYSSGGGTARFYKYAVSTGTWTELTAYPNASIWAHNLMYDPSTGKIFSGAQNTFGGAFFNTSTETWSSIKGAGTTVYGGEGCSAWDPTRGRGVNLGANYQKVLTIDFTAETVSAANLSASGDTTLVAAQGVSCLYDQARDVYWIFGGSDSGPGWSHIYEMNASTFAVTAHALSATIATTFQIGSYGRFVFLKDWRAIGIVAGYNTPASIIKLPPASGSTTPSFDFSLTNGGSLAVNQGSSVTNTVSVNLVSGTTQPVSFSASGLPSGAAALFSTASCNPTCSSTLTLSTSAATPQGTYTVTITGTGGSLSRTTTFTLTVNAVSVTPPPPGIATLLVKFGATSALNDFGLNGWSTAIKDAYTDNQAIGPGGTTIVVGNNYSYNYQGVTGTARSFFSGDKIRVTWYNNAASPATFTPNITFTDPDRIGTGATGTWYPMTSVTVPAFGSAASEFTFTSASAGTYSLVNVNVNYSNTQVIVADKIELVPTGTASPSDTTAPTVSITSPLLNATVGGTINVTASASDNVGVTGVQLKLDGTNLGSEISASPYAVAWNTAQTSNGAHTLTAVARDAAGNISSSSVTVTVNNGSTGTLPLGTLAQDGPATPEQLSLYLPITGTLSSSATATVRYKPSSSGTWTTGHPLYRIRPDLTETPNVGTVPDAFAWPIIDLTPGTSYDVEVTVTESGVTDIKTATFVTRSLPVACGPANKTITAGSNTTTIQTAFNNLNPGDVIQFQDGTYNVDGLYLQNSGTSGSPICIRGATRGGTILSASSGRILYVYAANNVILENLTMQGSGIDAGLGAQSLGISFYSGVSTQTNFTVRNVTITGVDTGIFAEHELTVFLAYDNTITGNDTWTMDHYAYGGSGTWAPDGTLDIEQNVTWNDAGILVPGFGNAVFNNTVSGFGDCAAYETGGDTTQAIGVHFYRNDYHSCDDDLVEVDGAFRNVTFYDNRSRNSMTFISLDPIFGGPFLAARNILINAGRVAFKWNSPNSGQFLYNNTMIRTTGVAGADGPSSAEAAWYQANNGAQNSFGFQNNLFVYHGSGTQEMRLDNSGYSLLDFSYNSWYPDLQFRWPEYYGTNLADAYSHLSATTPVFSGITKRHEQDNITVSNPWTTTITLGANFRTEVTGTYVPTLSNGDVAKNSGAVIPNITDGYSGVAPDRGAIIAGRTVPIYGDRSAANLPASPPAAPSGLSLK